MEEGRGGTGRDCTVRRLHGKPRQPCRSPVQHPLCVQPWAWGTLPGGLCLTLTALASSAPLPCSDLNAGEAVGAPIGMTRTAGELVIPGAVSQWRMGDDG